MASLSSGSLSEWLTAQQTGAVRFVLVGIGLMCLVRFRPQGLFGKSTRMKTNVS